MCNAWLMLVQSASHMFAMEADMRAGAGEGSGLKLEASCWNKLVSEFADVLKRPGMPAERNTVHRIKLELGATPPFRCQ